MPVDAAQRERYSGQAPELLASTDAEQTIMKRDAKTDFCVKFEGGLCGIQTKYGADFVGDACHFYPRILRNVAGDVRMGAYLSCPEIARLVLTEDAPFALAETTLARMPVKVKQLATEDISSNDAAAMMEQLLAHCGDETRSPEAWLLWLIETAEKLDAAPKNDWPATMREWLAMPAPQHPAEQKPSDPYALLYSLAILIARGPVTKRPRLEAAIAPIEQRLDCKIDWANRDMAHGANVAAAYPTLKTRWQNGAEAAMAPALRRWLQAQLTTMNFPFGSYVGMSVSNLVTILAVRFATLRLALVSHVSDDGTPPDLDTTIRIMQSLSRLFDHLADAELSLLLYRDAGWLKNPNRLRGLLSY